MAFEVDIHVNPGNAKQVIAGVGNELGNLEKQGQRAGDSISMVITGINQAMSIGQQIAGYASQVSQLADAYTNLGNRINQVAKSQAEHAMLMEKTRQIADAARADWASTGETFVRLSNATKEMGLSQGRVLQLTETISKAFSMSGASASEASAGMLQLSQAFASGKLQGDEFRSLAEAVPSILDLVAKQMGVSRGALKQLGSEGKITSDVLVAAFTNAQQSIENGFAKTAPTISQQWTQLKNQLTETFGKFAQDSHIFEAMSGAFKKIADALGPVVEMLGKVIGRIEELMSKEVGGFSLGTGVLDMADKVGLKNNLITGTFAIDEEIRGANLGMPQFIADMQRVNAEIQKYAEARATASGSSDNTPWGKAAQEDLRTTQERFDGVNRALATTRDTISDAAQFEALKGYLGDLATRGVAAIESFGDKAHQVFASIVPDAIDETLSAFRQLGGDDGVIAKTFNRFLGVDAWNTPEQIRDQQQRMNAARHAGARHRYQAPILNNIWEYSGAERVQQGIDFFKPQKDPWDAGGGGSILDRAKGVWEAMKTASAEANKAMTDDWKKRLLEQQAAMDPWTKGITQGWDAVLKQATDVSGAITQTMTNMYKGVEDSIVSLVTTGKASFSDLVNSIMADLARLATRQLFMSLLGALSGGGTKSVFGTGATQVFPGLYGGGHATGGSWKAPSTGGGPDSIPVMFHMSPGETAHFTPQGSNASGGGTTVVNHVQLDDRQLVAMIDTPAGRKAIANVIRTNPGILPFGRR